MKQECTSTNIKLSTLNIKYYNFGSSFDTIEFCSGNVHIDAEVIHSMIQGQHLALRCHPHKWSMRMGSPSTGPTVESRPLTGNHPRHDWKREKNYMHKLDQQ
jgi:hypothetical protein